MNPSLTVFSSVKDNDTSNVRNFEGWDHFENFLYELAKLPGYKPGKDEPITPKCSPLISPASFPHGATRKNINVESWSGWAALDVDHYSCTPDEAISPFTRNRFVCYSTASSTKEHPKFRVVFPLTNPVAADDIKHFWYALNKEFNSIGDPQTKDLSRMYYVPAQYPNAFNFIFSHKTAPVIDPSALLLKHPYVDPYQDPLSKFPPEVQKEIVKFRKSQLINTNASWSSYRNCPFVSAQAVTRYKGIVGAGWYTALFKLMVHIACRATEAKYPISANQIADLCYELDRDTGSWYAKRPIRMEAQRAIDFAIRQIGNI